MNQLHNALEGMRVLDFSQGIAGPHGACLLGEMGAEVIKIEPPEGDWLRVLGARRGQSSVLYATFNKGKRGLMLNLKQPAAREVALQMIAKADVMLESNRVGVMKRLGLDYETVRQINPRLVYVSVSGFGQDGPYTDRPATDAAVQAYSGFSFGVSDMITPMRVRLSLVDIISGIYTSNAVVAALLQRGRTGEGQYLDIALAHCITAVQAYKYAEHELTGGKISGELFAGIGIYKTADGFIAMSAMKEQHVIDLMGVLGLSDRLQDPRFATPQGRFEQQDQLRALFGERFATQPSGHWLPLLRQADLIHQEVLNYDAYRRDPQVLARELFAPTDLNEMGRLPTVRMPGLDADTPVPTPPPRIGQHGRDVLAAFGIAASAIADLIPEPV
jgi:crotonobetainyl-CoA:carnitine CoA-transferase CaiB-like acyl-CoA transferase